MKPLVALHIQHRPWARDFGAVADLDEDGVPGEPGEREVDLVTAYVHAAREVLLVRLDVEVSVFGGPDAEAQNYATVQSIVNARASARTSACLYVACHVNAGGGRGGHVGHDHRSARGASAAGLLASSLALLSCLTRVSTVAHFDDRDHKDADGWHDAAGRPSWLYRGYNCIQGVYTGPANVCGVLYEPFYIDQPAHRSLTTPEGTSRVGYVLADGIEAYLRLAHCGALP